VRVSRAFLNYSFSKRINKVVEIVIIVSASKRFLLRYSKIGNKAANATYNAELL